MFVLLGWQKIFSADIGSQTQTVYIMKTKINMSRKYLTKTYLYTHTFQKDKNLVQIINVQTFKFIVALKLVGDLSRA